MLVFYDTSHVESRDTQQYSTHFRTTAFGRESAENLWGPDGRQSRWFPPTTPFRDCFFNCVCNGHSHCLRRRFKLQRSDASAEAVFYPEHHAFSANNQSRAIHHRAGLCRAFRRVYRNGCDDNQRPAHGSNREPYFVQPDNNGDAVGSNQHRELRCGWQLSGHCEWYQRESLKYQQGHAYSRNVCNVLDHSSVWDRAYRFSWREYLCELRHRGLL